jgi:hypothetical protein
MVHNTQNYWVLRLCPWSGILKTRERFGNWICFHSQVKGVETPTLLGVTKHIVSETGSVFILR